MTRRRRQPRKTEFLGIPLDRQSKRRLVMAAAVAGIPHTRMARTFVMDGLARVERDQQQQQPKTEE